MTDGSRIEVAEVYRTVKGRIALHTLLIPNEQASDWGYSQQYRDRANWHMAWGSWEQPGEYQLDVFDDVEPLKDRLPEELYRAVSQAMHGPAIEDLDI
jgi:EXLDI family protein